MADPVRAIVTDIEGTVLPVTFVTEVLFPYARERLGAFLRDHHNDPDVARALGEMGAPSLDAAEALLLQWMDEDRKTTPLKTIQGLIWERGYREGAIRAILYPEVAECLTGWRKAGVKLFVYSSGSVLAQKLLFAHTQAGDLTGLFDGFFDTRIGAKTEPASYEAIRVAAQLPAQTMLFLSDTEKELDAAKAAGLLTIRIARDGTVESRHAVHGTFRSLPITP